jgi:Tol biopolymer transport system component
VWIHDSSGDRQLSQEGYAFRPAMARDGEKVFYMIRRTVERSFWIGELWSEELKTGRRERVLPDFLVQYYDVSPDGKLVAFSARDAKGKPRIWIASTERRFPPRQLSPSDEAEEQRPFFGKSGDIFFMREEPSGARFVYRMKADGTGRGKAVTRPVQYLVNISPDENGPSPGRRFLRKRKDRARWLSRSESANRLSCASAGLDRSFRSLFS